MPSTRCLLGVTAASGSSDSRSHRSRPVVGDLLAESVVAAPCGRAFEGRDRDPGISSVRPSRCRRTLGAESNGVHAAPQQAAGSAVDRTHRPAWRLIGNGLVSEHRQHRTRGLNPDRCIGARESGHSATRRIGHERPLMPALVSRRSAGLHAPPPSSINSSPSLSRNGPDGNRSGSSSTT